MSVAGIEVAVGRSGVSVGGTVGGMGVLVGVSVGGRKVAVGGTDVAVGDGLVPQPLTVKTRKVTVKNNANSLGIFVLILLFSNMPATGGFLPGNSRSLCEIPPRVLNGITLCHELIPERFGIFWVLARSRTDGSVRVFYRRCDRSQKR